MTALTVVVFVIVYLAMALGKVPGFKVDRAGAALIGALLLQVSGAISLDKAWASIDYRTMAVPVRPDGRLRAVHHVRLLHGSDRSRFYWRSRGSCFASVREPHGRASETGVHPGNVG
ncbi:MAG: hypothetical protein GY798_19600 [Hyphomicrobiales bacterium]|nr:hypothetical protein [Hyphomicrobiales bacterium]